MSRKLKANNTQNRKRSKLKSKAKFNPRNNP